MERTSRGKASRDRRRLTWSGATLVVAAVWIWAWPAGSMAKPARGWAGVPPPGFKLGGEPARGRRVYLTVCAACHGTAGDGRGESAAALDPKPTDLTDRRLLGQRSDWELYRIVRDGGPVAGLSPMMAGVKFSLSDSDIRSVTAYVRTLAAGK